MHPYISVFQVVEPHQYFRKFLVWLVFGRHFSIVCVFLFFLSQILAFILIRNIPGYARSVYSSFFAWFGKISLEVRLTTC